MEWGLGMRTGDARAVKSVGIAVALLSAIACGPSSSEGTKQRDARRPPPIAHLASALGIEATQETCFGYTIESLSQLVLPVPGRLALPHHDMAPRFALRSFTGELFSAQSRELFAELDPGDTAALERYLGPGWRIHWMEGTEETVALARPPEDHEAPFPESLRMFTIGDDGLVIQTHFSGDYEGPIPRGCDALALQMARHARLAPRRLQPLRGTWWLRGLLVDFDQEDAFSDGHRIVFRHALGEPEPSITVFRDVLVPESATEHTAPFLGETSSWHQYELQQVLARVVEFKVPAEGEPQSDIRYLVLRGSERDLDRLMAFAATFRLDGPDTPDCPAPPSLIKAPRERPNVPELDVLRTAGSLGFHSDSRAAAALSSLLRRPERVAALRWLCHNAEHPAGRLYAIDGLWAIDPMQGQSAACALRQRSETPNEMVLWREGIGTIARPVGDVLNPVERPEVGTGFCNVAGWESPPRPAGLARAHVFPHELRSADGGPLRDLR